MTPTSESATTDLRQYVQVLRDRAWQIALVTLLCIAGALFYAFQSTPIYQGTAKVLVNPVLSSATQAQPPTMDTERTLVSSPIVAQRAVAIAARNHEPNVTGTLLVSVAPNTQVLTISFDGANRRGAALRANDFANAYIAFRSQQAVAQLQRTASAVQQQVGLLQNQLTDLDNRISKTHTQSTLIALQGQRDSLVARMGILQQRLEDVQSSEAINQNAAQVIGKATVPRKPVKPDKVKDGLLGLLAGLVLGLGIAFLRERLDDRLKGREEIERRLGAPVLAAIPRLRSWRQVSEAHLIMRDEPKSPVSEAYRTLATNIQYAASRQPLKVLMVTSAMGGEGKTTTSANLALVLARAGRRVVLVSADLRRPRVHKFFELSNGIGMADALTRSLGLTDVVKDPGIPNLRVVPGGPIPEDPADLLAGPEAGRFLDQLREVSDYVILDSPPVLAVADASILAPMVDATVFVMDADHSSRAALGQARDQLENAGTQILGAVYNNFDPSKGTGYGSYYYYYQYYGVEEDAQRNGSLNGQAGRRRLRFPRRRAGARKPQTTGQSSNLP